MLYYNILYIVFVCGTYIYPLLFLVVCRTDNNVWPTRLGIFFFFLRKLRGDPRPIWYNRTNHYTNTSVYLQHGYRRPVSTLFGWGNAKAKFHPRFSVQKRKRFLPYIYYTRLTQDLIYNARVSPRDCRFLLSGQEFESAFDRRRHQRVCRNIKYDTIIIILCLPTYYYKYCYKFPLVRVLDLVAMVAPSVKRIMKRQ